MFIPYGRQEISEEDIAAVAEVLRSDFLTQGNTVPAFEQLVARRCGARHAIAANSATSALHLAAMALGVGPGDWLWTSPITFVASANCALYCGAQVDFVDVDPRTYNLSVEALERKLGIAQSVGKLPKVLVAVHLAGQPCDMRALADLARRFKFRIIEDASHAIGGEYLGQPIGNCEFSDITVFSFHPVKVITSGEGGMALTQDHELAARMQLLRSHGITRDPALMLREEAEPWYYEQIKLGFNYRMTDVLAALGMSQLTRLDDFLSRRRAIAARYEELLKKAPLMCPYQHADGRSGLHLYVIRLRLDEISATHLQVFQRMRSADIGVNLHYIPVYRQPYYAQMGFDPAHYPNAEAYYAEAISVPMYPGLTETQPRYVVDTLLNACRGDG